MPLIRPRGLPGPHGNIDRYAGQIPGDWTSARPRAVQGTVSPVACPPGTPITMQHTVLERTPPNSPGSEGFESQQRAMMNPSAFTPPQTPEIVQTIRHDVSIPVTPSPDSDIAPFLGPGDTAKDAGISQSGPSQLDGQGVTEVQKPIPVATSVTAPPPRPITAAAYAAAGLAPTSHIVAPSADLVVPATTHLAAPVGARGIGQASVQYAYPASSHPAGAASSNEVTLTPVTSRAGAGEQAEHTPGSLLKAALATRNKLLSGHKTQMDAQRAGDSPALSAAPVEPSPLRQSLLPSTTPGSQNSTMETFDGVNIQSPQMTSNFAVSPHNTGADDDVRHDHSRIGGVSIDRITTKSFDSEAYAGGPRSEHRPQEELEKETKGSKVRAKAKKTLGSVKRGSVKMWSKFKRTAR